MRISVKAIHSKHKVALIGNSPNTTTSQQPAFIGKDFGDFTDIQIVGGTIGNHQTGVLHNGQGVFIP